MDNQSLNQRSKESDSKISLKHIFTNNIPPITPVIIQVRINIL